uniref:Secreted protein n=1 Tax=Trichuris muris TaxID=70415 RepID=A0A5S6QX55_TRIMR
MHFIVHFLFLVFSIRVECVNFIAQTWMSHSFDAMRCMCVIIISHVKLFGESATFAPLVTVFAEDGCQAVFLNKNMRSHPVILNPIFRRDQW